MFDSLSANAIMAFLPTMTYEIPGLGVVDLAGAVAFLIVFVGLCLIFWFIRGVVLHRVKAMAEKTHTSFDDQLVELIESVRGWVLVLVALYAALQAFVLPETAAKFASGIFYLVVAWQVIDVSTRFLEYFMTRLMERGSKGGDVDPNTKTAAHMISLIARIVLWALGALFVLSNLGIEVGSLIAGLGIGGIAIAFALQGVLGDLFASLSIYLDKPFRLGDFIVIGTDMGVVEKIGIKSTRIRTLQGEELVVSNTELTTARVQNFKKMQRRRVVMTFGVTYETPQDKLKEIPGVVSRIFEALEDASLDRAHFASFGDSALIYELVYFVETSDYAKFMDIQQTFNFDLMARFAEMGVDFAYPTQTI
jgi:small-conductance mechanosensitive channel